MHKSTPLFSPICSNRESTAEILQDQVSTILIKPSMANTVIVPRVTWHVSKNFPISPRNKDLLKDPAGNHHLLIQKNSLKLVAWTISRKTYRWRELPMGLQTLSSTPGAKAHLSITNWLGENGLAGAVDRKCVLLDVI